jgi:hypothetical protein
LAPAKRGTGSGIASNRVPAFWTRGVCPCYDHLAQVAACDACYQVVSAQNGQKRGPRTMATDKSPSPRLGRGLVVAMAEFPTAFRPHTISGQNVRKRRLPGSGTRLDASTVFLNFSQGCANLRTLSAASLRARNRQEKNVSPDYTKPFPQGCATLRTLFFCPDRISRLRNVAQPCLLPNA